MSTLNPNENTTAVQKTESNGGAGADFVISQSQGDTQINDFNPHHGDKLVFDDSWGIKSKEELVSIIKDINNEDGNIIVNFGDNVTITLVDVKADDISLDDVVVGGEQAGGNQGGNQGDTNPDRDHKHDHKNDHNGGTNPDRDHKHDHKNDHHNGGTNPDRDHKHDHKNDHHNGGTNPDRDHKHDRDHKDDHHNGGTNPGSGRGGHHDHDGHKHKHVDCRPGEHHGEAGADNFAFHDVGHWRIDDFNASEGDVLDLSGYGKSREEIVSLITDINNEDGNFVVNFGDDVSITLVGVNADDITWTNVDVG